MSKASNSSLFFYQGGKLVTVKQGEQHRAIFRHSDLPLAEQHMNDDHSTALLATDEKGSVLSAADDDDLEDHLYSAYGHAHSIPSRHRSLGFNGECIDNFTAHYLLGNGYRAYSTHLMRFNSTDNLSPFGEGGMNAYAYCANDPVNSIDPSGHLKIIVEHFRQLKRQPAITITKFTTGTKIPPSEKLVKQGKKLFYSKTWQPDPIHQYETHEVHIKKLKGEFGLDYGAVESQHLTTYNSNRRELKTLQLPENRPHTYETATQIASLERHQRSILEQGSHLLARALNPNDLTTHIRDEPRVTPGSSRNRSRR